MSKKLISSYMNMLSFKNIPQLQAPATSRVFCSIPRLFVCLLPKNMRMYTYNNMRMYNSCKTICACIIHVHCGTHTHIHKNTWLYISVCTARNAAAGYHHLHKQTNCNHKKEGEKDQPTLRIQAGGVRSCASLCMTFCFDSFFFARVRSLKQNESRCEHAARHSGVNSGLRLSLSCSLSFSCSPLPSLSPRTAYRWRTHTLTHSALRRLALLQRHVPSLFQIRCVCACVFLSAYLSILKCAVRVTSEKPRERWQEYICITYVCFPISVYVI